MLPAPYLLYLGDVTDQIQVKTSRGVAVWRPELCVGQYRLPGSGVDLGLPEMTFAQARAVGAQTLILGVANVGGVMGQGVIADVVAALDAGLNVAAGLHDRLEDVAVIREAARANGVRLFDVRHPPSGVPIGNGRPRAGRRLLTVGTDCSVGKMYSSLALEREMRGRGWNADFRATGQTGIMIAGDGISVDAVVADFISGAAETISPARDDDGWDIVEGQGSLFHPSYAGVSLGLLHGAQPAAIVMCHDPSRPHMRGLPARALPSLAACLEANLAAARLTSPDVQAVGVCLNTSALDEAEALRLCEATAAETGLPCQDPYRHGVARIVDRVQACFATSAS
ncbi:N-acetyltransferase DgcN [Sphingomonas flavalba]|uniref:N-acetyltransferase DgcN n=1 Tax=Sphingomonas flavalba TaxID=2559804 RepID=UPI0019CF7B9D|nr:N-acetyltransferase DgcN [Sphingomonas flavalba]